MFKPNRILIGSCMLAATVASTAVFAAPSDVSSGKIQISGSIPEIFSLQARGVPGDLDLSPNVVVNDRPLGFFHLKYNISLASLILSSDSGTGLPRLNGSGADAPFSTPMAYKLSCAGSVDPAQGDAITAGELGGGAKDLKSAGSAALTAGIEEDCLLSASWVGTTDALPLAGRYAMTITLTMTSI